MHFLFLFSFLKLGCLHPFAPRSTAPLGGYRSHLSLFMGRLVCICRYFFQSLFLPPQFSKYGESRPALVISRLFYTIFSIITIIDWSPLLAKTDKSTPGASQPEGQDLPRGHKIKVKGRIMADNGKEEKLHFCRLFLIFFVKYWIVSPLQTSNSWHETSQKTLNLSAHATCDKRPL